MAADVEAEQKAAAFQIVSITSLYGAVAMTRRLPFMADLSEQDRVLIATVVSELGTNILKYAGKGTIRVQRTMDHGHDAIQVSAVDRGKGIDDVEKAMTDHFSTSGTLGMGLPAVNRMMTNMAIETTEGEGTRIVANKWLDGEPIKARQLVRHGQAAEAAKLNLEHYDVGLSIRPIQGERVSGDISVLVNHPDGLLAGLIDVSGHGSEAHALACEMQQTVEQHGGAGIGQILERVHQEHRGSRGAAIGLALLDQTRHKLLFSGVGNISIWLLGHQRWRGVSRDGIIGQRMRSAFIQEVDIHPGDMVVMTSDGISESTSRHLWDLYRPGMKAQDFSDMILRDAGKNHDDASCLIVRCLHP
ncbi:ATP-binding SpoIIE family protein phosphatase [Vulcanococcus limneticus]|uniref:ATP-binding SpoIIE family protein phosphatase n=1 Tax=Vulcanococcus limneticus TaxID=2170428 RepID=UPI00398BFA12